jgi:hypothetical protein
VGGQAATTLGTARFLLAVKIAFASDHIVVRQLLPDAQRWVKSTTSVGRTIVGTVCVRGSQTQGGHAQSAALLMASGPFAFCSQLGWERYGPALTYTLNEDLTRPTNLMLESAEAPKP